MENETEGFELVAFVLDGEPTSDGCLIRALAPNGEILTFRIVGDIEDAEQIA